MTIKKTLETIDFIKIKEAVDFVSLNKKEILMDFNNGKISEEEFYSATALLTPQSRSSLYENAIIFALNGTKNKAKDNIGDAKIDGTNYEIKVSGVNVDKCLHMVQLRPWQDTDYLIQFIDMDNKYTSTYFVLTHDEMANEIKLLNANAAHGTEESNKENKNVEYRITLQKGSKEFLRWVKASEAKLTNNKLIIQISEITLFLDFSSAFFVV